MLLDYIVGLGMDAFKGYLTEKYDERQMKADINHTLRSSKSSISTAWSKKNLTSAE